MVYFTCFRFSKKNALVADYLVSTETFQSKKSNKNCEKQVLFQKFSKGREEIQNRGQGKERFKFRVKVKIKFYVNLTNLGVIWVLTQLQRGEYWKRRIKYFNSISARFNNILSQRN